MNTASLKRQMPDRFNAVGLQSRLWLVLFVLCVPAGSLSAEEPADDGWLKKDPAAAKKPAPLAEYMPELEKLLSREMHFLRKVCLPNPEQATQLRQAGQKQLLFVAAEIHERETIKKQHGDISYRELLTAGLLAEAKQILSAEQSTAYAAELAARREFRIGTVTGLMAANLDQRLMLNPDQFESIERQLESRLEQTWINSLLPHFYSQFGGPIAELPVFENGGLSDRQRRLWRRIRKIAEYPINWNEMVNAGFEVQDVTIEELMSYPQEAGQ